MPSLTHDQGCNSQKMRHVGNVGTLAALNVEDTRVLAFPGFRVGLGRQRDLAGTADLACQPHPGRRCPFSVHKRILGETDIEMIVVLVQHPHFAHCFPQGEALRVHLQLRQARMESLQTSPAFSSHTRSVGPGSGSKPDSGGGAQQRVIYRGQSTPSVAQP